MKQATVVNTSLMFDVDQGDRQEILDAIDLINSALQREPYGLGAQIFYDPQTVAYTVEDCDGEAEENDNILAGAELSPDDTKD